MAKQVSFFDGAQSSTTPTIGNVDTTNLACYANDAAYEAANAGAPAEGNVYCNTTDNTIRYYNGTTWTELADSDSVQTFTNKTIDGTDATGTNTITNDATDVSYDNSSSGMSATDAQAAIDEVEARLDTAETNITTAQGSADANTTDIADIRTTQGTSDGDTDMGTFTGSTLSDNSDVKTLLQELEDAVEAVGGALVFAGTWNADTNTPTLSDGTGTQGNFYIVDTAGTTSLDGISDWSVNDWAIFDGTVWRKIDNSELVTSVNGQTGNATIGVNDLDGLAGTNGARREIRRDSGNTAWEIYNPHNNATDAATGANAILGGVGAKVVFLNNGSLESIGGVGAGYANQTFILINKTGVPVTINNEDVVATAADRILTGTSGPIDLDVDAAIPLVYDNSSSRWRLAAGTGGGTGGLSGIITGNNSTADSTLGDWVEYADTAQSTPEDGTGGSPNITLARTTTASEILQGKASFEITKGAFDRQGEGVSVDIPVDKYLRGQSAKIGFSYEATVDFDFGSAADPVGSPSDISVFLYDVTNDNLLTPSQTGIFGGGAFEALVSIPSDCEDIRVIFHIATTNALAWDFRFDRVQLDLAANDFIKNSSDWLDGGAITIDATTTAPTKGTTSNDKMYYRIDGNDLVVRVEYKQTGAGVAGSGDYLVKIPNDYKIDTTKVKPYTTVEGVGLWNTENTVGTASGGLPTSNFQGSVVVYDEDYVRFAGVNNDGVNLNNGYWASSYFALSNATTQMFAEFRVPIKGLTSGISHPAAIGLNAKAVMRATKNGGAMGAFTDIGSWTTVEEDSLGAFNSATGVYTVKNPGSYYVLGNAALTGAANVFMRIKVNGTSVQNGGPDGTQSLKKVNALIPNLKYGDTISVEMSSAVTASSQNDGTSFQLFKIGSESQPYAPKVAYLKDVKPNNTPGGTFTSGAWQTRDLNTLTGDQSFISVSSNQFTLQPGTYHIESEAPAFAVDRHKSKLRNITDATDTIIGESAQATGGTSGYSTSLTEGTFSIASAKTFEIQHRCLTTLATNGFGLLANFGVDEVYTQVKITKVL